eukprot:CAMPEP_0177614176 /NCGR_PEP_ID=MMETSP0419_2-20121207/22512_1 /TAXON_ID=582737 /ORGANISM="Tetraselmis sp., Strain GSL018" /LENGTH=708 /DNA_ID=CAMNT_0019111209 /DNA_START=131 /DNA_END=2257 /DNA_ORIENTATION=-
MGASASKQPGAAPMLGPTGRGGGITDGGVKKLRSRRLPSDAVRASQQDFGKIKNSLNNLLLFGKMDEDAQNKVVAEMYEKVVRAGEILIKEGDKGAAANELYVVKSGEFEVLQMRQGVQMKVNSKQAGHVFGEISLMYNCPRNATVAATVDSVVWVLERDSFRYYMRELQESATSQIELFLNSVPILTSLSNAEKMRLVDALEEKTFQPGQRVITQGDKGDLFYIIKDGEASVFEEDKDGPKQVNHLFKADFFGEKALLSDEPRAATVEAVTKLICLTLQRKSFVQILGPLQDIMAREKSEEVVSQRMTKLMSRGVPSAKPAEVRVIRPKDVTGALEDEVLVCRGHLDEVQSISKQTGPSASMVLVEGTLLGGGAFSRVAIATEETSKRKYALKCMRKTGVVHCPEHVFCEQAITKNTAHPFCIRQYASFQDRMNLYFLFDLMTAGDLMDVLVAEAKVIQHRIPKGSMQRGCLAPKVKMLKGMEEELARFYVAGLVLALSYLHEHNTVYRDLKPENVFIDDRGYIKLGDFGFAKVLEDGKRTYTFCGTPGYVAPENVLAHGYNYSVDWWGLGVLMYVLLTGRQPFSSPKTDDPMVVMRRIVDENWHVKFPPYMSEAAKDLILRLLVRKPAKRLGMLSGRAQDIKEHKWFEGLDWDALEARKMPAPRIPQNDSAKRIHEMTQQQKEKANMQPQESPEEIAEAEATFADF